MKAQGHPFIAQLNAARRARWRQRIRLAAAATMLCLVLTPLGAVDAQPGGARSCAVAVAQGKAMIERAGQRSAVAVGTVLTTDDRLVSLAEARIEIRCNDGVRVTVGADTTLELATLIASPRASQSVVLRLLNGIVRVALPTVRSWRRFEVQTPTAVASVRSTDWIVQTEKSGATAVFVVEGQVLAANRAGSQGAFLQAGDGIDFRANGAMTDSVRWGAARVSRTLAAVTPR